MNSILRDWNIYLLESVCAAPEGHRICKIYQIDFGSRRTIASIPKVGREGIRTLIDSLSKNLSAGERIAALPPYQFLNELIIVQFKAFRSYSFTESIELSNIKYRNHAVITRFYNENLLIGLYKSKQLHIPDADEV